MSQTSKIKNLWGDLPLEETIRTPYVILKEQASLLTEMTNGLLVGYVEKKRGASSNNDSYCILRINVPSINNYSIDVVHIDYPITIYPSYISNLVTGQNDLMCETEQELNESLKNILSSDEIKKIISGLLSEVHADVEQEP